MKKIFVSMMVMVAIPGLVAAQGTAVVGTEQCITLTHVLERGQESSDVLLLQTFLEGMGFFKAVKSPVFGPKTAQAVMAFQEANGLTPAPRVGNQTLQVLKKYTCQDQAALEQVSTPESNVQKSKTNEVPLLNKIPCTGAVAIMGDFNCDDVIDIKDKRAIDNGFLHNLSGWRNGDSDTNEIVDFDDFARFDRAWNLFYSPTPSTGNSSNGGGGVTHVEIPVTATETVQIVNDVQQQSYNSVY
jgi:hypothetical protein